MSTPKLCIDVCAGRGGHSSAFTNTNYEVVTIDIERKFKPTIIADVENIPLKKDLRPEVLLMSPPCDRFTLMSNYWPKPGIKRALNIVGACLELVPYLQPKHWCMENPKGRLRWFIGNPHNSVRYSDYDQTYKAQKPTDFWGNIPFPLVKKQRLPRTKRRGKHTLNFYDAYRADPAHNAEIPLGVSLAVKEGVESV